MKAFFLSLSILLAQLIAQAQSGPWNLRWCRLAVGTPKCQMLSTIQAKNQFTLSIL